MTMIQLYLLQSLKIPMKSRLMKYFIALNMVIVLLLSSTYSSGLASVMTVPRYGTTLNSTQDSLVLQIYESDQNCEGFGS